MIGVGMGCGNREQGVIGVGMGCGNGEQGVMIGVGMGSRE